MVFFEKRTSVNLTGKLLRDALIQEAKEQGDIILGLDLIIICTIGGVDVPS